MCIIIHKQNNIILPQWLIAQSIEDNPDGFGYLNLRNGQLTRTLDPEYAARLFAGQDAAVIHCRFATRGKVTLKNCHPFRAGNWLLFQNGTVDSLANDKDCDCRIIANSLQWIKPGSAGDYLSLFDSRFLLYSEKDRAVIKTGDWHNYDGYSTSIPVSERTWKSHSRFRPWLYWDNQGGNKIRIYRKVNGKVKILDTITGPCVPDWEEYLSWFKGEELQTELWSLLDGATTTNYYPDTER